MSANEQVGVPLPDFIADRLMGGIALEARTLGRAQEIREQAKLAYGESLLDGRLQLLAIAAATFAERANIPGTETPSINDRLVLLASFFQGVGATESLISEGQYVKAAAVLKQDLEILTRVHEVLQGVAQPGKTPNVRFAPAGAGRLYGQLNDVAHPSNPALLVTLLSASENGNARGVSYVPAFRADTAVALYELHVWLLLELSRELLRLMEDLYGPDPTFVPIIEWWLVVAHQLVNGGHIATA